MRGIHEKSFFNDAVEPQRAGCDAQQFLKTFDVADDFPIFVGYKNAEVVGAEFAEETVHDVGDERKCREVGIDGNARAKGRVLPTFVTGFRDGSVEETEFVRGGDFEPCVAEREAGGDGDAFEGARALSNVSAVNLDSSFRACGEMLFDGGFQVAFHWLPDVFGNEQRAEDKNRLLGVG